MASPSTPTMQAVVQRTTGGPDVLLFEQLARPRVKARDVLIRVAACGVCFHDIVVRNGTMKQGVDLPVIPGHEIAGAAARQAGVTVQRGDVVLVRTGWTETMLHDPHYYDGEPGIDVEAAS